MASKTALLDRPDAFSVVDLPKNVQKVSCVTDTRVPNCSCFTIQLEDHTLGYLLCNQLLKDPSVMFAAYHVPHPLENKVEIRIQSTESSTPYAALYNAINYRRKEVCTLQTSLLKQLKHLKGN